MAEKQARWLWQVLVTVLQKFDPVPGRAAQLVGKPDPRYQDGAEYEGRWIADLRHGQAGSANAKPVEICKF